MPRRWFQFSVSNLLWLTLAVAAILFGYGERQKRLRYQADTDVKEAQRQQSYAEWEEQCRLQVQLLEREVARAQAVHPEFKLPGTPAKNVPAQSSAMGPKHW